MSLPNSIKSRLFSVSPQNISWISVPFSSLILIPVQATIFSSWTTVDMAFDLMSPHLLLSPFICPYIIHRMMCQKWKSDNFASLQWFFSVSLGMRPFITWPLPLTEVLWIWTIFSYFCTQAPYFFSCLGSMHRPRMCFSSHMCLVNSSCVPSIPQTQFKIPWIIKIQRALYLITSKTNTQTKPASHGMRVWPLHRESVVSFVLVWFFFFFYS